MMVLENISLKDELVKIVVEQNISIRFQQILNIEEASLAGYEALCRGPSDSALHSPLVLFEAAEKHGLLVEMELMVLSKILETFSRNKLPGMLFLNMTAYTLVTIAEKIEFIQNKLEYLKLTPANIVVELTETHPIFDQTTLESSVLILKEMGIQVALDDLGEGFSSLKRWSVMRPDFVKIDKHFIEGLHRDPVKQQFIKSIIDIARVSGAKVIVEGIEEGIDLRVAKKIGVNYAQGFFIARPDTHPRRDISLNTVKVISSQISAHNTRPKSELYTPGKQTAGDLAFRNTVIYEGLQVQQVLKIFQEDKSLLTLPVLNEEKQPIGILRSKDFLQMVSKPYFLELYSRKDCKQFMDSHPLIFDEAVDLRAMSQRITNLDDDQLMDGFIVTSGGQYVGTGRMTSLIKAVSDAQVFAARYANPLTFLPGNVPIDEQITTLLSQEVSFVAVYWDLNNFKPYNDIYGYAAGDELIKLTADILQKTCSREKDFIGHIGGDDFVTLHLSSNWKKSVKEVLKAFEDNTVNFMKPQHLKAGGFLGVNRQGKTILHPPVSLSAGVLPVKAGQYHYPGQISQVMAELKKKAKKLGGNTFYVDRRQTLDPNPILKS